MCVCVMVEECAFFFYQKKEKNNLKTEEIIKGCLKKYWLYNF
jgi:hypothetical protein